MEPFTRSLSAGDFGGDVMRLQRFLEFFGYGDFIPTGIFGSKTKEAVINFQKQHQILATGFFGPITRAKANSLIASENRLRFLTTAINCLGTDASPMDIAPDEYGCAETINAIHKRAFGFEIGGGVSTYSMYQALLTSKYFAKVDQPEPGDVIISPTGYGTTGNLKNGHVGICGYGSKIMSNNSTSGLFEENYTFDTWRTRYVHVGGYPMVYFRRV